ncbi:complex I subunit 4 family protein [Sulfurospirillum arcachonense]|uniref:complex I subunit 4 family protein n=1 Tax=Sulfurospirillum arcachonense TaxID=57666 RepID=UPI00046A0745|nr:NADH-quinone oxidoreductase subunit M [Sulfurospirillum arcachonense]
MDFGILSVIIFLPMFVAFSLLLLPVSSKITRNIAFMTAIVILLLAGMVYYNFELTGYMQFREHHSWISSYGINYSLGIDGLSLIILMLIATLIPCAYLWLWDGRTKGYWVSMLLIQTGITGTLFSQDLILFYFFWEAMLLPVFMIIGMFGTGNRVFSTIKITVYTIMGSLFMLICILYLGVAFFYEFGSWSFALNDLIQITTLSRAEQIWLFAGFMLAFAIKIPLFPFHTWLLETYSNSPTGGVFLLSSIMAKLGVYGIVRFVMPLFPELYKEFAPYFVWIGIFGLLYFGIAALMQINIKKMFAYSSASHLGFIVTGIFSLNAYGMTGAAYLIIAHAMATGGLFLLIGKLEYDLGIKSILALGGIAKKAPLFTVFFAIMLLCIVGLPGTNGFVSEFLIILGTFGFSQSAGIVSALTVLVAASFMFWLFQRAILQDNGNDVSQMKDLNLREVLGMLPLIFLIIGMGVYPDWFFYKIEPTIQHYLIDILEIRT